MSQAEANKAGSGLVSPRDHDAFLLRLWRRVSARDSLVGRLIRLASAWFIFALVLTGIVLTTYFHEVTMHRFQERVGQIADSLYSVTDIDPEGIDTSRFVDARASIIHSGLYWQVGMVDGQGQISAPVTSRSLWNEQLPLPPEVLAQARAHSGTSVFYDGTGPVGEPLRVAVIYSMVDQHAYVFMAGEDASPVAHDVRTFALLTAGALFILALGSLAAIFIQVRVGLRPLFDLTDEISHVQGGFQQRLTKTYPAEIRPVARQLNAFLDYAQEVVERQRMHVGNLAHALKTPLSVLMTAAREEGAGDADGPLPETVRKQAETMRAQVDHHLRRARAAARSQAMGERTPVEPVFDELAVMLEQVFQDKGVIIDWRVPDHLAFRGERQDLQEIAGNLLENACIWCKRQVRINAEFHADVQMLDMSIEDDGPGLDAARFDEVLKRGARLDESVPGSGLGLSIVDELVRAYGGALHLDRSGMGGLKITARLPANLLAD
ncbi:ATP-binding protein [Asticcacaulis sp. EMRT-3]|uniref:ATP-binding protein n=1 Tax=Asticcacaulis sp. EMRT-3 TaxID=3040349 RepID=UPI0024AEEDF8|nr:ATP-binding protein [Asticcacaulis sp. EMRT-3]MDI7775371.1 ATP-binding protein [Asticcacaulis sp. EMRT-3]